MGAGHYFYDLARNKDLIEISGTLIPFIFLSLCRIVPFVHLNPYLGSKTIPIPVKVAMAIGLFLFMAPVIAPTAHQMQLSVYFFGYLLKEFFLGYLLGTLSALPSYILMMTGTIIDHQRGASSLMLTDPVLQVQDSLLGILFVYLIVVFAWNTLIPFIYIDAVARSFEIVPLNGFLPSGILQGGVNSTVFANVKALLSQVFAIGIELAAPSLIILLMTDMFLGIVNRLAPQVQITFLSQGLKALLALVVLFMGWRFILMRMGREAYQWAQSVRVFAQTIR